MLRFETAMDLLYSVGCIGLPPLIFHRPSRYDLQVIQQPFMAKAANGKDKVDRKPVDPPPILQLNISPEEDPEGVHRQSPYLLVAAFLEYGDSTGPNGQDTPPANIMTGTMVSSLHRLKDTTNKEGAFFIFGDLTVRTEGEYILRFDLFQMEETYVTMLCSVTSQKFRVHAGKNYPGMAESTFLTRSFSDQGVRLRLRKDSRALINKRKNLQGTDDMEKRQRARQGARPQNGSISQIDEQSYYPDYGQEPSVKKHKNESSINSGTPTPSDGSAEMRWGPYASTGPPYSTPQTHLGAVTTGPPSSASMVPIMPPPTGRIDTHFTSLSQGAHVFGSPAGERHSPMTHSPIQFGNPSAQSPSPFLFTAGSHSTNTPTMNLAPLASHGPPTMTTPTLQNVSPRSHARLNGTTPSGTASPVGANMYTTAPPSSNTPQSHHHHAPYTNAGAYHSVPNAFDHGTLREHGMGTPLTANMPAESLNNPYSMGNTEPFDHHLHSHMVHKSEHGP
ncbi:hypothetical protein F4779DRAFT_180039 [Xylariaceae sp. FL0662B]|nr:hypothetical protein F4779DRAFT_180039 [Xylariaceae sp. FL0662B]